MSDKTSKDEVEALRSLLMQCKPYIIKADREGPHAHPRVLLNQINAALEGAHSGETGAEHGEVTVVTNEDGECVAVTRTDDEHRILKIIWERNTRRSETQVLTVPEKTITEEIVDVVFAQLWARSGLENAWDDCDSELQADIRTACEASIRALLLRRKLQVFP